MNEPREPQEEPQFSALTWITALPILAGSTAGIALLAFVVSKVLRLAEPEMLWWMAVPVAMVAAYLSYWIWRAKAERLLGHVPTIRRMAGTFRGRSHVARFVLTALAAILVVVAMARPQWGERAREVQRRGIDIVIALDISRSMNAEDVPPSRLDAAVREVDAMLRGLDGDRVGLVVFAGIAFTQSPLTSDYGAIRLYTDRISPDDLPIQGTAIGAAIDEARELLTGGGDEEFERADSQMIIVVTDGEDHVGDPIAAAAAAREAGIDVHVVGVGTAQGGRIPVRDQTGALVEYLTDRSGQTVITALATDQLEAIANAGGGSWEVYTTERSLADFVLDAVEDYDSELLNSMLREEYVDRYAFFLIPAFFLLLLASVPRRKRRAAALIAKLTAASLLFAACGDSLMRPDPRVEEAMEVSSLGDHEAALVTLDEMPEDVLAMPELQLNRGLVLDRLERTDVAQEAYLAALETTQIDVQGTALVGIGNTLFAEEDYRQAIERYQRALRLNPDNQAARTNLEIALRRMFPPCAELDDELEDNDDAETPSALPQEVLTGTFAPELPEDAEAPEMVACGGDADWFAIPVMGDDTVTVEATFRRLRADNGGPPMPDEIDATAVRIALLAPNQDVLAVDQGLADAGESLGIRATRISRSIGEHLIPMELGAEDAGFIYLQVEVDDPYEYTYELEVEYVPPCRALEDDYEDNDTFDTAAGFTEAEANVEGRLCADDPDWFHVTVEPSHSGFVDISALQTDAGDSESLQVSVYTDPEGTPDRVYVVSPDESMIGLEWIDVQAATEVWIKVEPLNGVEGNYQLLYLDFPPCPEGNDRYEPNDTQTTPAAINAEEQPFRHLRLCEGDEDWYRVTLPPEEEEEEEVDPEDPDAEPAPPEPVVFSALVGYREPGRFVSVDLRDAARGQLIAHAIPQWAADAGFDPTDPNAAPPGFPGQRVPGQILPGQGPPQRFPNGQNPNDPALTGPGPNVGSGAIPEPEPAPLIRPTEMPPEVPEGGLMAVAAGTQLDPGTTEILVRVAGEPGFYHLSFPDTQSQQQQQQQSDESSDDSEESEDSEDSEDSEESDEQDEMDPEDQEEQDAEDEQAEQDEAEEEDAADPMDDEALAEMEREMLLNLLESLSPEDRNLPLQQALENAPRSRQEEEW